MDRRNGDDDDGSSSDGFSSDLEEDPVDATLAVHLGMATDLERVVADLRVQAQSAAVLAAAHADDAATTAPTAPDTTASTAATSSTTTTTTSADASAPVVAAALAAAAPAPAAPAAAEADEWAAIHALDAERLRKAEAKLEAAQAELRRHYAAFAVAYSKRRAAWSAAMARGDPPWRAPPPDLDPAIRGTHGSKRFGAIGPARSHADLATVAWYHTERMEELGIRVASGDPGRATPVAGVDHLGRAYALGRGEWRTQAGLAAFEQRLNSWKRNHLLVPTDATSPTVALSEGTLCAHSQRSPRTWAVVDGLRAALRIYSGLRAFYGSPAFRLARYTVRGFPPASPHAPSL